MVPIGLILTDSTGNIEIINPDASRLLMTLNAGLVTENFFEMLEVIDPELRQMVAHFPQPYGFICRSRRILIPETGKKSKVLAIGITIHKLGAISGLDKLKIMISDETTALNKEKAYRVKTEFLANMSHEIRTPLNAMLGLTQLLERTALDETQHDLVQRISSAGEVLLRNLNDVLDFSKIESGQMNLQPRHFCLNHVVSNLYKMQCDIAHHAGLSFTLNMPAEEYAVYGDDIRLSQILLNLTNNAIKFTPHGGVSMDVKILATETSGYRFRFQVADTGIGIHPGQVKRLFRPFTQLDSGTNRRFDGTGLGLSICKSLIDLMGGTIGVDSTEGVGSTFWFELPLPMGSSPAPVVVSANPHDTRSTAAATEQRPYKLADKHILIVDDNEMNRYMAQRVLHLEGAQTSMAVNGQDAVRLLSEQPNAFDVVLMDVQMPIMDGLEATRRIRTELGLTQIPIIVCSAGVQPEDRQLAMAAGANEFIIKPIHLDTLAKTLYRVCPEHVPPKAATTATSPNTLEDTLWTGIPGLDGLQVRDQLDGDTESYQLMLGMLINEVKNALQALPHEAQHPDPTPALHRLHKLRGGAGSLYAHELVKTCAHLESILKTGATAAVQSGVDSVLHLMHELVHHVESALKRFAPR